MKILLDANISWKLTKTLPPIFGECQHVDNIDITIPAQDVDIWNYAKENEFTIITKDNDFVDLLEVKGYPPKIVLLKPGNNSSNALVQLLINSKKLIQELNENDYGLLELINVKQPI